MESFPEGPEALSKKNPLEKSILPDTKSAGNHCESSEALNENIPPRLQVSPAPNPSDAAPDEPDEPGC